MRLVVKVATSQRLKHDAKFELSIYSTSSQKLIDLVQVQIATLGIRFLSNLVEFVVHGLILSGYGVGFQHWLSSYVKFTKKLGILLLCTRVVVLPSLQKRVLNLFRDANFVIKHCEQPGIRQVQLQKIHSDIQQKV